MTNMSYCVFENTVDDMNQCIEKLEEHDYDLDSIKSDSSKQQKKLICSYLKKKCKKLFLNIHV